MLKGSCLFLDSLFILRCCVLEIRTSQRNVWNSHAERINPLSYLPPLLFVCVWLRSLDSGFLPSPAFDACVCHWVQTCSASSLQPFKVLEFLWSYQRLFFLPLSCNGAPLFVVCMLNVVTGDGVSCTQGTFRGAYTGPGVFLTPLSCLSHID